MYHTWYSVGPELALSLSGEGGGVYSNTCRVICDDRSNQDVQKV